MKSLLPLLGALALFSTSPWLRAAEDEDLKQLEQTLAQHLIKGDVAGLEQILAPDWRLVTSDASITTREELLTALKEGTLKFSSYAISEVEVRVYGDAAVVLGRDTSAGIYDGAKFTSRDRFTDVFIRQNGQWRCVATHSSEFQTRVPVAPAVRTRRDSNTRPAD